VGAELYLAEARGVVNMFHDAFYTIIELSVEGLPRYLDARIASTKILDNPFKIK